MRESQGKDADGGALQLALRELQRELTSPRTYLLLGLVIIVVTIAGPFGTFAEFALLPRLAYWAAVILTSFLTGTAAGTVVKHALIRRGWTQLQRLPLVGVAVGLAASVPVTLISLVVFGPDQMSGPMLANLIFYGLVFGMVTTTAVMLVTGGERSRTNVPVADLADAGPANVSPLEPRLLRRLPLAKRGALISLSVEDHYVTVVTSKGREMVLLRLTDAIGEAEPIKGLRIHRSHWVAQDAIRAVLRVEGRLEVETVLGDRLPVSRGYAAEVKAAGLLPG